MAFFEPDRYFSRLSKIDIKKDIIEEGLSNVLLDVDNTILTRDTHEIPRDVGFWLSTARNAGLQFCLLTNNWHSNVYELAASLDLPIVGNALKPLPPGYLMALRKIGAQRKNTVVIGDQLLTDVFGAHFVGMKAYLLRPLVKHDLKHTLLLRNLENIILGDRQPEGGCLVTEFDAGHEQDSPSSATGRILAGGYEGTKEREFIGEPLLAEESDFAKEYKEEIV